MTLGALRHLPLELEALAAAHRLRSDRPLPGVEGLISLCSNDYLGLASEPTPELGAASGGAGASRLVFGECDEHRRAEAAFASWLGYESALLFSSGYAANVGALGCLFGEDDIVVSDALNHASIIDGCRLAGTKVRVVPHRDVEAVERELRRGSGARRRWVVTESYFSMDGDGPDLRALRGICDRHDAGLIVDEAHSIGVFGEGGRGLCAAFGVKPDVLVLGCGKALGAQGGVVLGPAALRTWLWNKARSFVFSTGVSPALGRLLESRVQRVREADGERLRLFERVGALRAGLRRLGCAVPTLEGPILPWVVGERETALEVASELRRQGILVQAIRPPTVPEGTSRLRLSARADLGDGELRRVLRALESFT